MRIAETKVYQFNELSEEAKERARQWWREGYEFHWSSEVEQAMKEFSRLAEVRIFDYEFGDPFSYTKGIKFSTNHRDEEQFELSGARALAWIENNILEYCRTPKVYYLRTTGSTKKRKSNLLTEINCPFTGMCYDMDILDPLLKFAKGPKVYGRGWENTTVLDLISECFASLVKSVEGEIEHCLTSDEYADDEITINEYEFTEDGKIF